jgi:small conductance mechanosensitive channel
MDLIHAGSADAVRTWLATRGVDLALNVIAAVAIFLVGRMVARVLAKALSRTLERDGHQTLLVRFLENLLYALMLVFVTVAALERLGLNTTSFAAVVAAAGLAIGLALQGSLSNFAAGVMIILLKHFDAGDLIEAGGQKGVVTDVQIFATVIRLEDGTKAIVPNNAITSGTIKVYARAAAKA